VDWPKVKTVLIVFLLVVNLILGSVYASRILENVRLDREMVENAVLSLKRLGVTVQKELLEKKTQKLYTMEVERDKGFEKSAFTAIVGEGEVEDLGSGILRINGTGGMAKLSGDGIFQVSLSGFDRLEVPVSGTEAALYIFKKMGISAADDELAAYTTGNGYTIEGTQRINGKTVFNRKYEMRFDDRGLYSMQGGRILGKPLVCDDTPSVSVVTALFAFVDEMNKIGTPCLEILDAELGYYAKSSAPGFTQIIPVWRIKSDLGERYMNAVTLELLRELPQQ